MERKKFVEKNKQNMVEDLQRFVQFPTVRGERQDGAPLGREIQKGLDWLQKRAGEMGFETINYDGYALEISAGNGVQSVGIVGHMDVVAAGNGWSVSPFQGVIQGDRLYGRGSLDDKGPLIACLYAMQYLREQGGIPDGKKIRMIIGTDEEENFEGIRYYAEHAEFPEMSFIPDGSFPVIYGEKGMCDFDLTEDVTCDEKAPVLLEELSGGSGRTMVPGEAAACCRVTGGDPEEFQRILKTAMEENHIPGTVQLSGNRLEIRTEGKTAHSMAPETGRNAIGLLFLTLSALGKRLSAWRTVEHYNQFLGMDYLGELAGLACADQESGPLTLNVGVASLAEGRLTWLCNLRYPMDKDADSMAEQIEKQLTNAGFNLRICEHLAPVYINGGPMIDGLLAAYREVTGDVTSPPITISGATYSRFVPNAVAFGPVYPDQEELAHQPDEFISLTQLGEWTEIYICALERLLAIKD